MRSYSVDWYHYLPQHVKEILACLHQNGRTAYVVGGAVRDLWLGLPPKDFDLVSDASPEMIESLFPKTLDIGRSFGIMVVVTPLGSVEIARFRTDGAYTDHRHPEEVIFADPAADARRRDFTINALFYDPAAQAVLDYVGGVPDLESRCLRTVGSASERFHEDALRMLRAVRFHAQLGSLGFSLAPELVEAIRPLAPLLNKVSRERITQEILKALADSFTCLSDLAATGLWLPVFHTPPLGALERFRSLNPTTTLAALAEWSPGLDPAQLLVLPKEKKQEIQDIRDCLAQFQEPATLAAKKQLVAHPGFAEAVALLQAGQKLPAWAEGLEAWKQKHQAALDPPPLLTGKDLIALGMPPGPRLRELLEAIREKQLNEEISSAEEAKQWALQHASSK